MKRINHNNDFLVILTPKSCTGIEEVIAIPAGDFKIIFRCGGEEYVCGRKSGVYRHCKLNNDGTLTCVFNNHGLLPGVLKMEVWFYNPNSAYPDDNQLTVSPEYALDVELTEEICDEGVTFNADLMMPFAIITAYQMAVKAGYKGTEEEWMRLMSHGFPKVVQQTGDSAEDVMSQKAATDALAETENELQKQIDKLRAERAEIFISRISGETPVFTGTVMAYSIQAICTEKADRICIKRDETILTEEEQESTVSATDTIDFTVRGKHTYSAIMQIGAIIKTASLTVEAVDPIWIGVGENWQDAETDNNKQPARISPRGEYEIAITDTGLRVYAIIPDNMPAAQFSMAGFDFSMHEVSGAKKGYKIYESENKYLKGDIHIKIQ